MSGPLTDKQRYLALLPEPGHCPKNSRRLYLGVVYLGRGVVNLKTLVNGKIIYVRAAPCTLKIILVWTSTLTNSGFEL